MSKRTSKEQTNLGTICFHCDESCHLTNDASEFMAIASIYCRKDRRIQVSNTIKQIKEKYNISNNIELKWNKVSPSSLEMYKEIFKYIKRVRYLKIRVIIANKKKVQKLSDSYNKMYYYLIEFPVQGLLWNYKLDKIEIFSDVKDSHSFEDMALTSNYLQNHFGKKYKIKVQSKVCESRDVTLIQIADLLAGAATYKNRNLSTSSAKFALMEYIEDLFDINFSKTTKTKYGTFSPFNVFVWDPEVKDENF